MPGFDGTGPRGLGMFTGRGQGYCVLRLPEPGSGEPAIGYAEIQGTPVQVEASPVPAPPVLSAFPTPSVAYSGRRLWRAGYAGWVWHCRGRGQRWWRA